jgi:hypothetical protein
MTGAFVDDPGFGAAIGASHGAVGGAATPVSEAVRPDDVLRLCLKERGYITLF